jgi:cytochrome P450
MSDFAVPLAITVIADILGVGRERLSDFHRWGNDTVAAFGGDQDALEQSFVAMTELFAFLGELIATRRATAAAGGELPDDVLTSLITSEYEGSRFTDDEILMASHPSTAIGNAVYLLCTNPTEREKLARNGALLDTLVEEVLRYEAPIEGLFRTSVDAVRVDSTDLPSGAKVRVVFASANRDERQFADPDTFRIDRDPTEVRRHLAFGFGPHACIGAPLARAELGAAIVALFNRLPGLALDDERRPERNDALIINGFRTLPVRWEPVH